MKRFFSIFLIFYFVVFSFNYSFAQDSTQNTTTNDVYSREIEYYDNVSSFDGNATSTPIANQDTQGIAGAINYIITIMVIGIVVLILFRLIYGAVKKGTYDNIYSTTEGKKMIQNAGIALIIFIFSYAVLSFINPDLTGWTVATKFIGQVRSRISNSGATCDPNQKYTNSDDVKAMLIQDEGILLAPYYDSLGIPTIGIGFNLIRDNTTEQQLKDAGVSATDAKKLVSLTKDESKKGQRNISGYPKISEATANKLLEKDIESHKQIAINYVGGQDKFNALSKNIQNVLINMTFNMGSLDTFVELKKGVAANDPKKIAKEIIDSQYCNQVGDRCSRLANLVSPTFCTEYQQSQQSSGSIAGSSGSCVADVQSLKQTDLVSVIGKIKCVESNSNPTRCTLRKEFLNNLVLLNNDYKIKFGKEIEINSSYRTSSYQRELCSRTSGVCATGCSRHMTGLAVDLSNNTIGGCLKVTSNACKSEEFLWLMNNAGKYGIYHSEKYLGNKDNVHWSTTGR